MSHTILFLNYQSIKKYYKLVKSNESTRNGWFGDVTKISFEVKKLFYDILFSFFEF